MPSTARVAPTLQSLPPATHLPGVVLKGTSLLVPQPMSRPQGECPQSDWVSFQFTHLFTILPFTYPTIHPSTHSSIYPSNQPSIHHPSTHPSIIPLSIQSSISLFFTHSPAIRSSSHPSNNSRIIHPSSVPPSIRGPQQMLQGLASRDSGLKCQSQDPYQGQRVSFHSICTLWMPRGCGRVVLREAIFFPTNHMHLCMITIQQPLQGFPNVS